jgi:hypothetical protein
VSVSWLLVLEESFLVSELLPTYQHTRSYLTVGEGVSVGVSVRLEMK